MPEPIVIGFPGSTYVHIIRLILTHKNVPYRFRDLEPEMGTPAHIALHPFGRVPVLQHGDLTLYETSAIATYIDEAFDGPSLQPHTPAARGRLQQWISSVNAYYYPELGHGKEYVLGADLSLADFCLVPCTYSFSLTDEGKAMYPKFPAFCRWRERMEALPSVQQFRASQPPRGPIEHARKWPEWHRPKY